MASTRTRAKTKAELKAEEAGSETARRQAKKVARAQPSAAQLAKQAAKDVAAAAAAQPKDDKQSKTIGIVARGHACKVDGTYKGPGEIVRASAQEIEKMRARGALVDEGRIALPMASLGPQVLIEDDRSRGVREPGA